MSLLNVGKACTICSTVDFLPFTCPHCALTLCRAHVHSHQCPSGTTVSTTEHNPTAGPSSFKRKAICEVSKCDRPSIESIGGREGDLLGDGVAKAVRCSGCGGAYCTAHRSQTAHSCVAPLVFNARHDALAERRNKAKALIAQNFPEYKDKVIPKPPPQKDVIKVRPKPPDRLPPSLQLPARTDATPDPATGVSTTESGPERATKTKAEKLRDLEVRKIKSLAKPLDPKMRVDGERRFFEWGTGTSEDVRGWEGNGKLGKKLDRAWAPQDTPIGRLLDMIIDRSKSARPTGTAPEERLQLLCLSNPDGISRTTKLLPNDLTASEILDGDVVLLVKGWTVVYRHLGWVYGAWYSGMNLPSSWAMRVARNR